MRIDHLDHLVLTVADVDATVAFYTRVLGMEAVEFGGGRRALAFGPSKINLHEAGREFEPKAERPTPGSADLCLITLDPIEQVRRELAEAGVPPCARARAARCSGNSRSATAETGMVSSQDSIAQVGLSGAITSDGRNDTTGASPLTSVWRASSGVTSARVRRPR
ncbi:MULTISPECIES: VOC family protein [Pseudonocardia]|uniref:VOC family protein n=1 Tax=Pseudonocardia TaxID=1847 RepID=UPI00272AC4DC